MLGSTMNRPMKTAGTAAGAFVLGGMMVLGIWLFCERRMITQKVTRLMSDATDMMENKFKDDANCQCECEKQNCDCDSQNDKPAV